MSDTKSDGSSEGAPCFGPQPGRLSVPKRAPAPADFKKWARYDLWHIAEAAMLLLGFEPFGKAHSWPNPNPEGFDDIYGTAMRSIDAGALRATPERYVTPRDALAWACEKEILIPEELEEAVNRFPPKAEGSPQGGAGTGWQQKLEASDAPLHERERDSLLKMVLGMAMSTYDYTPGMERNRATGENQGSISADLHQRGLALDADTVRKFIKEAETRFKHLMRNPQKP